MTASPDMARLLRFLGEGAPGTGWPVSELAQLLRMTPERIAVAVKAGVEAGALRRVDRGTVALPPRAAGARP